MASFGHIAVGMAAGRFYVGPAAPWRERVDAMVRLSVLSLLPDLDAVGFLFGVPYGAPFGHRGASHALATALLLGAFAAAVVACVGGRWRRALVVASVVAASHGLLDSLTDGGHGIALLWPFDARRIFAPWRPIPVAPIGSGMFSARGRYVVLWELAAFFPLWAYALTPRRASQPAR
ncbi:MAG: metal-dependent hydrolase [Polyangiales bacterium]